MIVRLVLKKRLCYSYSVLPTLFNRSIVAITWQWTVAAHVEVTAVGRLVEEHD